MKVAAVIAEYNPFHNGHLYHLSKTREAGATHIVAIMSGSFTQRGEPAVFSKYTRALAAVKCGVDLVLELPVRYSLSSARHFAEGAVSLAKEIGCVDLLSFGCECGSADELSKAAAVLSRKEIIDATRELYTSGYRYPDALSAALNSNGFANVSLLLSTPNNLLAAEYLRSLGNSGIVPFSVSREGAGHDSNIPSSFASAFSVRSMITDNKDYSSTVPKQIYSIYSDAVSKKEYYNKFSLDYPLLFRLRMMSRSQLSDITDCSDGLGDRIYSASRTAVSYDDLIKKASTKRYTVSRVRRALMNALIGIKGNDFSDVPYARILAIGQGGKDILSRMKNTSSVKVSGSFKELVVSCNSSAKEMLYEEERASDIYSLLMGNINPCGTDYTRKLIIEV